MYRLSYKARTIYVVISVISETFFKPNSEYYLVFNGGLHKWICGRERVVYYLHAHINAQAHTY